jgi:hypothetical protein
MAMTTAQTVLLEFSAAHTSLGKGKELRDGLSTVLQIGDTLWLANDETISLERLSVMAGKSGERAVYFGNHTRFVLSDYLRLPAESSSPPEEADIEGLAYEDGYLWLVGSHSLKRKNPDPDKGSKGQQNQLAKISSDGNRFLLARVPVVQQEGAYLLVKAVDRDGAVATAAQLHGTDKTSDLIKALKDDEHLGAFFAIPGKDNGFDIEGLAVSGRRLFLGLRGPVLRGWAVILEVELEDGDKPGILKLKATGPDGRCYRKHFLHLGGLGIRDLCRQGADLLILAGPTMDLDGPVAIFRWPDGMAQAEEAMVFTTGLHKVLDVPFGQGVDHAEGMTLFSQGADQARSILVVYDAAAADRKKDATAMAADLFRV